MSYASLNFLILVIVLMCFYYVCPKKYRWIILLLGNIYFFMSLSGKLIIYSLIATIITYALTILLESSKKNKKKILILNIFLVLAFLLVLKYDNFFLSLLNPIINLVGLKIPYKKFILPIGISYYTLEMIAYSVDVYRKKVKAETNFLKLFTFFTYFPKLIEGPISKYSEMKEKMFSSNCFDYEKFKNAWVLIGYGFIKKMIIADRLGIFVDKIFEQNIIGLPLILAVIFYTIQIYCDFSGCIDIVSGVSELFGINLPVNFKRPFFSTSIQEFWTRWHITLGAWLKEYIFYPISLSKLNMKLNMKVRKIKFKHLARFITIAFPLLFVWLVNGLWHGASIKYVTYGLYYYLLMMLGVLFKPILDFIVKKLKINTEVWSYKLFKILRTILIVCIGMLLFRSDSLTQFTLLFKGLFSFTMPKKITEFGLVYKDFRLVFFYILIIFGVELAGELKVNVREKLNEQNLIFRWLVYIFIIFSILIFGVYGYGFDAKSFIYGGF